MAHKWKDLRKGPSPKPLSPEEYRTQAERLARLDKLCEGMDSTAQFQLLELADRYTRGEITFEEFEATVRSWAPKSQTLKTPDINEVFAALDAAKFPDDFLSDADRDRRPLQDRPEVEALMADLNAEDSRAEQTPEPPIAASSKLTKGKHGFLVVKDSGPAITSEMVREESEDDIS